MIDPACNRRRAKPVVDVHDGNARGTAVQHAQECRQPSEARTVPNAGRNRDHGHLHEPAHDARECPFHARHDDDHPGGHQARMLPEQPMDAGDTDVEQAIDRITHHVQRHACFLGNRQVGGARGCYQDRATALEHVVLTARDGPGNGVKGCGGHDRVNGRKRLLAGTRDEQRVPACDDLRGDGGDLRGGLPEAEDHFREALAKLALMIHPGETEILERLCQLRVDELQKRLGGGFGGDLAVPYLVQQLLKTGQSAVWSIIYRRFAARFAH